MDPRPFLLAGVWTTSEVVDEICSPFDGAPVARVCRASLADVHAAIEVADEERGVWEDWTPSDRAALLERAREGVRAREAEITEAIVAEGGKPVSAARLEAQRAVDTFTDAIWACRDAQGELVPLDALDAGRGRVGLVRRVPLGPITAITPFNFPFNLVAHKLCPAIVAGCPVILKPAPQTPSAALILGEILLDAGLPPAALSILPLAVEDAAPLIDDPRMKVLSFTGSEAVGWALKARAPHMHTILELGGNAATYVAADADLDHAVSCLAAGAFGHAGQSCISVQRIFVHTDVFDEFLEAFVEEVTDTVRAGDPRDPRVTVGPLIRRSDAERVEAWVADAVAQGAVLHCGGTRQGSVVAPTVLSEVADDADVVCKEVFGPVVSVLRVPDDDIAFAAIDDSAYGLQAGIFTRDVGLALRAWRELDVGGVIQDDTSAFRVDLMPYGGVKGSGVGREGPRYAWKELTSTRILVLRG